MYYITHIILSLIFIGNQFQVRLDSSAGELPPLDKSGGPPKEKSRKLVITEDLLLSAATFRMPTCKIR